MEQTEPDLQQRIVGGTLAQQLGQALSLVSGLVVATALGRTLSVSEFGVYGLVISFSAYLYFGLGSAEAAAIRLISAARDQQEGDRAFTSAMVVYAGLGLAAGVILAGGGVLLLGVFGFPHHLVHEGRLGVLGLAAVTALGWPIRLHLDLLRASHRFALASLAETGGFLTMSAALLVLSIGFDAPLWILITVGSAIPLLTGVAGWIVGRIARVPHRFRLSLLRRDLVRDVMRTSSAMLAVSSADVVISSLDRVVLGLFRSAASLGLYEAASRLTTLIRGFMASFSVTLLPVTSRLTAAGDEARNSALFVRGTRYILAAIVPPTVTIMVLADRILGVWLGEQYAAAGGACAIFLAWWLLAPNIAVPSTLLFVDGRLGWLATYSWMVAAINLVLSLVFTALWGIEGVALGTSLGYALVLPYFMRYALRRFDLRFAELVRAAWRPAYVTGAVLAGLLGLVRWFVPLDSGFVVLGITIAAPLLAYLAIYGYWLEPDERALVRGLLRRPAPRAS